MFLANKFVLKLQIPILFIPLSKGQNLYLPFVALLLVFIKGILEVQSQDVFIFAPVDHEIKSGYLLYFSYNHQKEQIQCFK